jgi:AcrR family transcriptional regulator
MATVEQPRGRKRATPVPATRQGEGTRERILAVAVEEFAAKGFAGARVETIARRAHANKQAVYYYFGGKHELYNAVLGRMVDVSRQRAQAETGPLAEQFGEMVARGSEPDGIRWQRLLAFEALDPEGSVARADERRESWRRHVAKVRAAQAAGEVDPSLDPELLALALVSIAVSPFVLPQVTSFLTGEHPADEGFGERYRAFVEELVTRLAGDGVAA